MHDIEYIQIGGDCCGISYLGTSLVARSRTAIQDIQNIKNIQMAQYTKTMKTIHITKIIHISSPKTLVHADIVLYYTNRLI